MTKRALLIGCNYPGTKAELHGCVNDVKRMYRSLVNRFGFDEEDVVVLVDTDPEGEQPTGVNIRRALSNLITSSEPGDVLFFHYSGHGVRVPAESGEPDDTGYDECIVPCDMNLITDDDFRELVDKLPEGVNMTLVSDSCHSGGLVENVKEQIGDSVTSREYDPEQENPPPQQERSGFRDILLQNVQDEVEKRGGFNLPFKLSGHRRQHHQEQDAREEFQVEQHPSGHGYFKNKSLPLSVFVDLLKQKTGKQDITVGNIRPTLFDVFGDDASPKVKKFVGLLFQRLQSQGGGGGFWGTVGGIAQDFLKTKLEESGDDYAKPAVRMHGSAESAYAGSRRRTRPEMAVLISGCQSGETSADANPGGNKEQAYGALSNAVQEVLSESSGSIPNRELVMEVRRRLAKQGFKQHPGLYCSDENVDAPFVCELLAS